MADHLGGLESQEFKKRRNAHIALWWFDQVFSICGDENAGVGYAPLEAAAYLKALYQFDGDDVEELRSGPSNFDELMDRFGAADLIGRIFSSHTDVGMAIRSSFREQDAMWPEVLKNILKYQHEMAGDLARSGLEVGGDISALNTALFDRMTQRSVASAELTHLHNFGIRDVGTKNMQDYLNILRGGGHSNNPWPSYLSTAMTRSMQADPSVPKDAAGRVQVSETMGERTANSIREQTLQKMPQEDQEHQNRMAVNAVALAVEKASASSTTLGSGSTTSSPAFLRSAGGAPAPPGAPPVRELQDAEFISAGELQGASEHQARGASASPAAPPRRATSSEAEQMRFGPAPQEDQQNGMSEDRTVALIFAQLSEVVPEKTHLALHDIIRTRLRSSLRGRRLGETVVVPPEILDRIMEDVMDFGRT